MMNLNLVITQYWKMPFLGFQFLALIRVARPPAYQYLLLMQRSPHTSSKDPCQYPSLMMYPLSGHRSVLEGAYSGFQYSALIRVAPTVSLLMQMIPAPFSRSIVLLPYPSMYPPIWSSFQYWTAPILASNLFTHPSSAILIIHTIRPAMQTSNISISA